MVNSGLEERRHEALANRDATTYYMLCNELGVEPEATDLYELGQAETESEQGLERRIQEMEPSSRKKRNPSTSRRASRFDYQGFKESVERDGNYQASNPFANTSRKRDLLKRYGVRRLWVGRDEKIPIEDARDTRVGQVFKDYYERAVRLSSDDDGRAA